MKYLSYLFATALLLSTSPLIAMDSLSTFSSEIERNDYGSANKKRNLSVSSKESVANDDIKEVQNKTSVPTITSGISLLTDDLWDYLLKYVRNPGVMFQSKMDYYSMVVKHVPSLESRELNDAFLCYYQDRFAKLTHMNLSENENVTDKGLSCLTNLTSLNLSENDKIKSLVGLTNLTSLNLSENNKIKSLVGLTKLKSLNLYENSIITDEDLIHLTNLESLDLRDNETITGKGLVHLTNLTSLKLRGEYSCSKINNISYLINLRDLSLDDKQEMDESLSHLTNLTSLVCNETVTKISHLTNLVSLNLYINMNITDEILASLTNLTDLKLMGNTKITDNSLGSLTKLERLNISNNAVVTDASVSLLTKLECLNISNNGVITDASVSLLTNLNELDITSNCLIKTKVTNNAFRHLTKLRVLHHARNLSITRDGYSHIPGLQVFKD